MEQLFETLKQQNKTLLSILDRLAALDEDAEASFMNIVLKDWQNQDTKQLADIFDEYIQFHTVHDLPIHPGALESIVGVITRLGFEHLIKDNLKGYKVRGKIKNLSGSPLKSFFVDMVIVLNLIAGKHGSDRVPARLTP